EIDIKNPKANENNAGFTKEERNAFSCLLSKGYIDTFRYLNPTEIKYSWWSYRFNARKNNAGWRIDYFVVSESLKDKLISSLIHNEIHGSDHCPIELNIDL
ncbi:MAG: exodeoxyribonuclease III, partial [Bacilli bacterium]|nr:exodeoxyribonuclease III [Bacilli bacterium]